MSIKPNAKPTVLGWLNPPANGRLTIKQNNTNQDKVGFGSLNQNQNPPYLLVELTNKQGFFSCFFSLRSCFARLIRAPAKRLSTGFQQSFQQWREMGVIA
ncbi:hypothetical protein [Enorma massiliensis]|uniref:hypothetical protein n=1 Tax=Enorma massiliensis TaxID=1472761 RepID=UPI003AF00E10